MEYMLQYFYSHDKAMSIELSVNKDPNLSL